LLLFLILNSLNYWLKNQLAMLAWLWSFDGG